MQGVLQITRKADYALRAAVYLASINDGRVVTFRDLAKIVAVPADFLAKILKELSDHGIVKSVRGPKGGYRLAKKPHEISFLEVVEAAEGPVMLNVCLDSRKNCVFAADCTVACVWRKAQDNLVEIFRTTNLEELTHPHVISQKVTLAAANNR